MLIRSQHELHKDGRRNLLEKHEGRELQVNDDNCEVLEQAFRLMELEDDSKTNQEKEISNVLKYLFGFSNYNILNTIEGFTSEEREEFQEESEADSSYDGWGCRSFFYDPNLDKIIWLDRLVVLIPKYGCSHEFEIYFFVLDF